MIKDLNQRFGFFVPLDFLFHFIKIANDSQIGMAYKTKQRELILSFFEANPDQSFSVMEIAEKIKGEGVSVSAIYRNLALLEKEGRVRKSVKQGTHEAYYRFLDCHECREHIHMQCVKCGKTTHLDDQATSALLNGVMANSDFSVDRSTTVLYGVCHDCAIQDKKEHKHD